MSQLSRLIPTSGPGSGTVTSVTGGNNITITGNPAVNPMVNVSGTTNHAVQVGNALGALTSIPVGANGQVLIGATGANPAFANLTSTGGTITFTLGANTLNLEAVAGASLMPWTVITVSQTAAINHGYITNGAGTVALLLPAVSPVGSIIEVTGMNNATGWRITQAAGQQIFFGTASTTLGAGGSLTSSAIRDSIRMVCVVANTTWNVLSSIGNVTFV